ncbi:transcriptional regulator [Kitasatospora sp. NBC_01250]|uniref:ScbA/BarX family gamma-butyrolactone biosynthesis protein n=1 Tax=unclassified Kitasatospora TaxID=2633591 RepID=UPI002E141D8A|nr:MULTISPECIES: ScbA/BarX family gamma-butyrolactone biosynthesis protein [unclassified Kitasatospora]WSJ70282.1 transcriptional regulator [Kitasatospora sp. NBC_01302]
MSGTTQLAVPAQPVTLTSTVPREYVHRTAVAEVFLTGWQPTGPDEFRVTAQWPRAHAFYGTQHGLYDPLLLCETIRQTFPLLSHAAYHVPFDHHLSWDYLRYTLRPDVLRVDRAPAEVELRIKCFDLTRRGNRLAATSMHFQVFLDGTQLATATTRFACHSPAVYRRLREGRADHGPLLHPLLPLAPAVEASLVGRDRAGDVVLGATDRPGQWELRAELTHPVLFDHPVDHAPGMLLLEAARQAAQAVTADHPTLPTGMDAAFFRYVELDSPCWITAESPDQSHTLVTARQHDRTVFSATLTSHALP